MRKPHEFTKHYDDTSKLEEYLTRNRRQLLTAFERLAEEIGIKREKAAAEISIGREPKWTLQVLAECAGDAMEEISAAIGENSESFKAFQDRVTHRVRADFASGVAPPNRCPNCHRIVKTPAAAQCLWCGHDLHSV